VYKVHLFLSRIGVTQCQLYNEENPKMLRYYVLTLFNTGLARVLVTTPAVFVHLRTKVFASGKRKILQFKDLSNIIVCNLASVKRIYSQLYRNFRGNPGTIISLASSDEQSVDDLSGVIE